MIKILGLTRSRMKDMKKIVLLIFMFMIAVVTASCDFQEENNSENYTTEYLKKFIQTVKKTKKINLSTTNCTYISYEQYKYKKEENKEFLYDEETLYDSNAFENQEFHESINESNKTIILKEFSNIFSDFERMSVIKKNNSTIVHIDDPSFFVSEYLGVSFLSNSISLSTSSDFVYTFSLIVNPESESNIKFENIIKNAESNQESENFEILSFFSITSLFVEKENDLPQNYLEYDNSIIFDNLLDFSFKYKGDLYNIDLDLTNYKTSEQVQTQTNIKRKEASINFKNDTNVKVNDKNTNASYSYEKKEFTDYKIIDCISGDNQKEYTLQNDIKTTLSTVLSFSIDNLFFKISVSDVDLTEDFKQNLIYTDAFFYSDYEQEKTKKTTVLSLEIEDKLKEEESKIKLICDSTENKNNKMNFSKEGLLMLKTNRLMLFLS